MRNETRPQRYCRGFEYQKLPIPEKASNGSRFERRKGRHCAKPAIPEIAGFDQLMSAPRHC